MRWVMLLKPLSEDDVLEREKVVERAREGK